MSDGREGRESDRPSVIAPLIMFSSGRSALGRSRPDLPEEGVGGDLAAHGRRTLEVARPDMRERLHDEQEECQATRRLVEAPAMERPPLERLRVAPVFEEDQPLLED